MSHTSDDPNPSLTALQILMRLQGGQFLHDLQESMESVSAGVLKTGKPGKVTIDITIDTVKGSPSALFFRTDTKDKVPKPASQSDIMYAGKNGTLHLSDPKQLDLLGPRPVPRADAPFDRDTGLILDQQPRAS